MKEKGLFVRITDTAVTFYLVLILMGELLRTRTGLYLIIWILGCIGWFVPVAFIASFFDPGADNAGTTFMIIALLSAISSIIFLAVEAADQPK